MKNVNRLSVADVMVTDYDLVEGTSTVAKALQECKHLDHGCVLVDRRNEEDEYGILLLSDIARKIIARDLASERVNIYEVMTKPAISVHPEMDIRYCSRLFEQFNLAFAPVVRGRDLVGLVSHRDIVLNGLLPVLQSRSHTD